MKSDLQLLKELEKEIGRSLEPNERAMEPQLIGTGYLLDENEHVIAIDLFDFELGFFPRTIFEFKKHIRVLKLDNNGIETLPEQIGMLENLEKLVLHGNRLTSLPKEIGQLQKLNCLVLMNNQIKTLPREITRLNAKITLDEGFGDFDINLYNNPLEVPPIEIVKQGKEAIRNYFQQLEVQEEDYIFEAKVLIVGEPGAGKTSMMWKMEDAACALPKEEDTTKGIDIRQYYFPLHKESFSGFKHPEKVANRLFRLNLWDFGGQEIYKATHRFFLSKRSLYVLVADSRNEDTDFNYWLHIVEMFGGESPLLIVLNEKYHRKRNLDISSMRNRFTN